MRNLLKSLLTVATVVPMMAVTFNNQLTWNLARFDAPEQEIVVDDDGKTYSINKEYNAELKSRHTDKQTAVYHTKGHKRNVRALTYFFGLVR